MGPRSGFTSSSRSRSGWERRGGSSSTACRRESQEKTPCHNARDEEKKSRSTPAAKMNLNTWSIRSHRSIQWRAKTNMPRGLLGKAKTAEEPGWGVPGPSQRLQGRADALHPVFRGPARLRPPEETNAGTQSGGARHTPDDRPIVPPHLQVSRIPEPTLAGSREGIREETKRAGRGQLPPAPNGYPCHRGCNPW